VATTDPGELAEGIRAGDRRALARAVTLVESRRDDDRAAAVALLRAVHPHTGGSWRVGISGAPGAGKSTFIEALGCHVIEQGQQIAVLAVDPSSRRSGGSILGDKTRMQRLAQAPQAFIRPSPAGGDLGGVAARTGEAMHLCEAAGFDVVLVETVGVGQSEVAVVDLVDTFVLLVSPGGGDELMELADIVVITKADGDLLAAAERSVGEHHHAVHLLRRRLPDWETRVLAASAATGVGIEEVWEGVAAHRAVLSVDGGLDELRRRQAVQAFWRDVERGLIRRLRESAAAAAVDAAEVAVASGEVPPAVGAWQALTAER
jgi:LAO/AO transport system kinase